MSRDVHDDVILTTYLTGMPDPQRAAVVPVDDAARLRIYPGCVRLGLKLVVFHDQLSEEFAQSQSTETVSFIRVPTDTTQSVNDYRFFLFRDWLTAHPCRNVFCSDGFDVKVKRNPHELVDDDEILWVGIHRHWKIDDTTPDGRHVARMMRTFYGRLPTEVESQPILMAGTWGGRSGIVTRTLDCLTREITSIHAAQPGVNCNLAAFNRVAYRDIGKENLWMKGAPLHSQFRAYDDAADVCFVHK